MKKIAVLALAAFPVLLSCATMSLHSPRPLEPGKMSAGIYGGSLYTPTSDEAESDVENPPGVVTGTFRLGLPSGFEVGVNAGMLGAEAALKYGTTGPADPFQLSLVTGVGFYYWTFLDANAGLLAGYRFGNHLEPYAGYRHHVILAGLQMGDVIGGLELYLSKRLSLQMELDYTIPYNGFRKTRSRGWGGDVTFDEKDFNILAACVGANFKF